MRRKIAGRIEEKIEKKGLAAAVTGRAGINYHLCSRQQRTQNSKWRIRRKTRDWSSSCSADWRKYKTDMTLPLQWRTMKIESARTIENRTYSTSPGQKRTGTRSSQKNPWGLRGEIRKPKGPLKDTSSVLKIQVMLKRYK